MINRISVKFFVEDESTVDLPGLISLFHHWIQAQLLPGLPIDVTDYKHVPSGPGIMLIGHEGDYALDVANGRSGFRYTHKRQWPSPSLADRLRLTLQRALHGASLLQREPGQPFTLHSSTFELALLDRLHAPNTPATFAAVQAEVTAVLTELFAGAAISVSRAENDPRQPFTLWVQIADAPDLSALYEQSGAAAMAV